MSKKLLKFSLFFISLVLIILSIKIALSPTVKNTEKEINHATAPEKTINSYNKKLQVNDQVFNIQLVSSSTDKERGLSRRESMLENEGMLFDMSKEKNGQVAFWMKDMKFDLDLIWIKDYTIQEITKNVPALITGTTEQNLELYSPQNNIDMVLELNAGISDKYNLKVGDKIILDN